jgi:hypothetical protein
MLLSKIKKFFSDSTEKAMARGMKSVGNFIEQKKLQHEGVMKSNYDCVRKSLNNMGMLTTIIHRYLDYTKIDDPLYPSLILSATLQDELNQISLWRKAYERECYREGCAKKRSRCPEVQRDLDEIRFVEHQKKMEKKRR